MRKREGGRRGGRKGVKGEERERAQKRKPTAPWPTYGEVGVV